MFGFYTNKQTNKTNKQQIQDKKTSVTETHSSPDLQKTKCPTLGLTILGDNLRNENDDLISEFSDDRI